MYSLYLPCKLVLAAMTYFSDPMFHTNVHLTCYFPVSYLGRVLVAVVNLRYPANPEADLVYDQQIRRCSITVITLNPRLAVWTDTYISLIEVPSL